MKQINTLPIENYLDKARVANKTGQKTVVLDIKEAIALSDSLALVMTRLVGRLDQEITSQTEAVDVITVSMDGGGFKN